MYSLYAFFIFFSPLVLDSKLIVIVCTQFMILCWSFFYYRTIDYTVVSLFALLVIELAIQLIISVLSQGIDMSLWVRMVKAFIFYTFLMISILININFFRNQSVGNNFKIHRLFVFLLNIVAVYCIIEYFLKYNPVFYRFFASQYHDYYSVKHEGLFYRVSGTMQHPIVMGNFLLVNVLFNFGLYLRDKKIWSLVFTVINLIALFMTFSRGSYLALAISILFYLIINIAIRHKLAIYLSKRYLKKVLIVSSAFILILFALNFKGINLIGLIYSRFTALGTNSGWASLYQRLNGFHFVMNSMLHKSNVFEFIFGNGFGSLAYTLKTNNVSLFLPGLYVVDNQYLTMFYEFGLIGICFFFYIVVKLFITCLKKIVINKNGFDLQIFLTAFLAILINLAFYDGFYWSSILILLSYTVAWILYLSDYTLDPAKRINIKLFKHNHSKNIQ
jgi:hypothetical protein